MTQRDEILAALRWAAFEAAKQKMQTLAPTKLTQGALRRREIRQDLATHERVLRALFKEYEAKP